MAMEAFVAAGADLIVSGHLHVSHTTHTAIRYKVPGRSALLVQAGTATSTRERGEPNSFNVLAVERETIGVERYVWRPGEKTFAPTANEIFRRTEEGWERASPREDVGSEAEEPARLG
jgi:3',5'-cyclic AMP phosphodiesterase CpdA